MKTRHREEVNPSTVPPETKRRGSSFNGFLAGAATMLALLALGMGGFLLYRGMQSGKVKNPFDRLANKNTTAIAPTPQTPASPPSPSPSVAVPQNPYVQLALGNKAQVELLSATRIPGNPDEVNVQMRVRRVADGFAGSETINVGATIARNPITSEAYEAVDSVKRSSGPIFLFNMRKDRPVDGYVVLKVPASINLIDIFVKDAGIFKNVLVTEISAVTNAENNSSAILPSPTPTPQITLTPGTTATDKIDNSSINTTGQTPAPQLASPVPSPSAPAIATSNDFKAGEFKRLAFGSKAEVELLSVKRIQDPKTGNRDVVNVQMRIRRLGDKVAATDIISVGETAVRNPVTSETYKAIDPSQHSTGSVSLYQIRSGASVDAYVWLRVPTGVQMLDIFIPETGAFQQVPISNY